MKKYFLLVSLLTGFFSINNSGNEWFISVDNMAKQIVSDYDEEIIQVRFAVPAGTCHCGFAREEVPQVKAESELCPQHGPTCHSNYSVYRRVYSYCTNNACGDNWYSNWEKTGSYHG